jgi:DNA end-binding protein Ku
LPDAPNGGKPYALLRKVMTEENLCAISQIVLVSQEELMVLRAKDQLLTITELDYASQVRDPEPYAAEAPGDDFSAKELELTRTLVEATTTEEFDFHEYKDVREECFREMIEAKVAGKEIVTPPTEQPQVVINLMEALRESLKKTGKPRGKVMPKHKPVPKAARRSPARKKKRA